MRHHARHRIAEAALVTCPAPGCDHVVGPNELRFLGLGPEAEEAYERHTLRRALESGGVEGAVACPTGGCPNYIVCARPGEPELVVCSPPGCGASFCSLCREQYHFRHSCEQARAAVGKWIGWSDHGRDQRRVAETTAKRDEARRVQEARAENVRRNDELKARYTELVRDEQWKQANLKRCPQCRRPVEKTGGCDLMRCGRDYHGGNAQNGCGAAFRWTSQALPYEADAAAPTLAEFVMPAPQTETKAKPHHGPYRCDSCSHEIVGLRFSCIHCWQSKRARVKREEEMYWCV
jgi:hypothetical protein